MQWHGHEATLPSETLLEAAWGLLEGSWVPLEVLERLWGGFWEALGGFQEASWTKDRNSYNFLDDFTKTKKRKNGIFGGPAWRRFNIKNRIF